MIQIEESNPSFESCHKCIYSDDSEETCILRRCIHAVSQLKECYVPKQPTIEPQQRWIPCSERLPEEYGEYRITWTTSCSKKRFIGDAEYEITGEWDAEQDRFKGEWLLEDYIKNYPDVNVLAWKPLEEPYAERRTDE